MGELIRCFIHLIALLSLQRYVLSVCGVPNVHIYKNHYLSRESYRFIIENIKRNWHCSDVEKIRLLKKEFPIIKSVNLAYYPTGCTLYICLYNPICRLNKDIVMMENGVLSEDCFMSLSIVQELPIIHVTKEVLDHIDSFFPVLHTISALYSEVYDCAIHSSYCIKMNEKKDCRLVIVCDSRQLLCKNSIDRYKQVKNYLEEKRLLNDSVSWVVDVRFADYIIGYRS